LLPKKNGFTLVEILVTVFILSIIIAALFLTLNTGEFSNTVASTRVDLQSQVRRLIDWIAKDVRQTSLIEINNNGPSVSHIKFKKVIGIDGSGNYLLSSNYTEYSYNSTTSELLRNELDNGGSVLRSWVYTNITQAPFYTAVGVPLVGGDILNSKKLVIVISGQSLVRNILPLNFTLSEEVKIRNE
jgi:prepilin-type N-terminal cleavage/methylation domain-containing protein